MVAAAGRRLRRRTENTRLSAELVEISRDVTWSLHVFRISADRPHSKAPCQIAAAAGGASCADMVSRGQGLHTSTPNVFLLKCEPLSTHFDILNPFPQRL